ncbi:dihydroneopterin triphosphate diphosphatase [Aliiglaciecola litoralis]|uniref:Dihydroneopterin triphosphate diphosphatase n=1 Tax=Aliiglaciecola litoralis TaxID=582857 RepID=A0ABN1LDC1_9ALTE
MAFRRPESALIVIYDQDNRVLLLQRQDDANFWQSVTGTLEVDEDAMQTAIREVKEETGIDIQAGGLELVDCRSTNQYVIREAWQHRYPPGNKINTEYVFAWQVKGDERIILTEHTSYIWLDKASAIDKAWSPSNQQAIAQFVPDNKGN